MNPISEAVEKRRFSLKNNVNDEKNINNNVNVIELSSHDLLQRLRVEWATQQDQPRAIAEMITKILGDNTDSLRFHITVAKNCPPEKLIECAKIAVTDHGAGLVKTTPAKYYVGILKRKGIFVPKRKKL